VDSIDFYHYNYSLYTPENIFNLNHQATPTVIGNDLWINYHVNFLDTYRLIEQHSETSSTKDYSLLPLAVRYSSPDGTMHVIERPPFEIEIDFSTSTSYRPRNCPKFLQSAKIWIPWTVSVISTSYQSSSFSNSFGFNLYFNDQPLQSIDEKLVPCYLPNSSAGNICMGQDSLVASQLIQNGSSITEVYNHIFNSYFGGWNCDLNPHMFNQEYFAPIIDRISVSSKKDAAILNNLDHRSNTSKYFKSLLFLLSKTSLQEHIGYITYTKQNNSHYPTLRRHLKSSDPSSSSPISQTYPNAVDPWSRIARVLQSAYSHYDSVSLETNYRVVIKNYDPSSILGYISNPYIISSIYRSMLHDYQDSSKDFFNEFQHDEVAPYIQQSETV
jgi:hypothetical protein